MLVVTEEVLEAMARAIVQAVHPERIVLFGSRASDRACPESDVDLLVVEREPFGPGRQRREELSRIRRSLAAFHIPKDILVYSTEEIDKWRWSTNHVIAESLRNGRVLYERS